MEETNFVLLWKEHYDKIDQSLAINKRLLKELVNNKAESAVRALIREKAFGIIAAVLYLALLGAVLFFAISRYRPAANYFIFSIGGIFLINVKALYDYIRHLVLINGIRYDGSVKEIQGKLKELQLSQIRHARIMVLQFPLWTTFFLSSAWFPGSVSVGYVVFQVLMTGSFTWLGFWLYKTITPDHPENRWTRLFISGVGGKTVVNALKFYQEMEDI
jgi:hypothetical protein